MRRRACSGVSPKASRPCHSASIFANEDFYDLCTRGRMDLAFLGAAQIDGAGRANNSCIGDWHAPKVRLPGGGGGAVMTPTGPPPAMTMGRCDGIGSVVPISP